MGILTTQDSARAFSTYVALFGLALLITSSLYLKDLNHWAEKHTCVNELTESGARLTTDILCSNYHTWRKAAVIGIVIGVIDVLVVPFLLCCGCCLVCGCTALLCATCACANNSGSNGNNADTTTTTANQTTTTSTTENERNESTRLASNIEMATTTTAEADDANDDDDDDDPFRKCNLKNLPKPVVTILNLTGGTVWVFLPFIGTLLITIWIYKTDAVRTNDDQLYRSALTLFVCALLNLMVFYQKFMDSVCKFACGRVGGGSKAKRESVRKESV